MTPKRVRSLRPSASDIRVFVLFGVIGAFLLFRGFVLFRAVRVFLLFGILFQAYGEGYWTKIAGFVIIKDCGWGWRTDIIGFIIIKGKAYGGCFWTNSVRFIIIRSRSCTAFTVSKLVIVVI